MIQTNQLNLAFEPSLQPVFLKSAKKNNRLPINDSRDLFYALIHISEHYFVLPQVYHYLNLQFQAIKTQHASHFSKTYTPHHIKQLLNEAESSHSNELVDMPLSAFLIHYAPIFFTELSWLAPVTHTATSNTPLATDLMAIYLRLTKGTCNIANSRASYVGLLLSLGHELPDVTTRAFVKQGDIDEEIFDLAAIQLGLTQFPRVFFPEILGFTLSYCHSLSLAEQFFPNDKVNGTLPELFKVRNQRHRQEISSVTAVIQTYLAEFATQSDDLWQRIQSGFWLHQIHSEHCYQSITTKLQTVLSPRQTMHKLLLMLIPHAIGHHGKIRIGGKTIDEWFKEKPFKSENFLATLLHSPYVDRAKPENSLLLKLYDFNGPMFGVLDDDAKNVVRNWLLSELAPDGLQRKKNITSIIHARTHKYGLQKISSATTRIEGLFAPPSGQIFSTQQIDFYTLSNKELYFYLVNHDIYPEVLPVAKNKAERLLKWAGLFNRLPFKPYTHQNFETYINKLFQHEVDTFKSLSLKPKLSKNTYIWGIEQFAPTILADGCWLQSVNQPDFFANHALAAPLQKIYADEAGNGILKQNHPHIYQQLLESVGIELPPIFSIDFVNHRGFINHAFDIPVYLMTISKFPNTFLPELLGLNMAIELSGLGKVYPQMSEELQYWGIDSTIVDIHTSIDNLATGHSALAIQAIQAYLDEVFTTHGDIAMQSHWQRIHTGFCSLSFVSWRFRLSLIKHYFSAKKYA